jgi:3-deoxy-alpha-D-manno-octulosonate 8-oxidase
MSLTSTGVAIIAQPSIFRTVGQATMAPGAAWSVLGAAVDARRNHGGSERAVFLVDEFFPLSTVSALVGGGDADVWISISTENEPYTDKIDDLMARLRAGLSTTPCAVVGIGGGITMDTAKAVSNLYGNPGTAESYQGWDLLPSPGAYKIAVPTISGTGAEASRTCVMTNTASGLKLGMNSPFTFFDEVILDSSLTGTVPKEQYFFTGMDTYMHDFESMNGSHRNPLSDALSQESLRLVREVFSSGDAKSDLNREKLMTASFLGGTAIAGTYVGLVHPVSAGLSVVFGTHHGVGNCIAMRAMEEFYPAEYEEFWGFADAQDIEVPKLGGMSWDSDTLDRLAAATLLHERPLSNALGPDYRSVLTPAKVRDIFRQL